MSSLFDLTGRVALITGASSGLGKRFAEVLAENGANVAILARRMEKLEQVAEGIKKKGGKCLPIKCDVTVESEVISAVAKTIEHFGKVDILINNAGTATIGEAENVAFEEFKMVMEVNTNSYFLVAREVGKNMIQNKYGRIINISSMFGMVGNKQLCNISYHTSKGAIINFARGLAGEWSKYNITINNVGPGFFESELTGPFINEEGFQSFVKNSCCMERIGNLDELDTTIMFLAANGSSYITGQTICVDGGWTCI